MNFLLLCVQSSVSVICVSLVKKSGIISFRDLDKKDAKTWFPISFLLVSVIYTGSKSLVSGLGLNELDLSLPVKVAILKYTYLHNFQELDYHLNCASGLR
jgi:hypothetical protein